MTTKELLLDEYSTCGAFINQASSPKSIKECVERMEEIEKELEAIIRKEVTDKVSKAIEEIDFDDHDCIYTLIEELGKIDGIDIK